MNISELIQKNPALHELPSGELVSFTIGDHILHYFDKIIPEGGKTVETGAGMSTLAFAIKNCSHFAIMPEQNVKNRILSFAKENGIPTDKLNIIVEESQFFVPNFKETDFDMVLIDGLHAFPVPFIDWLYLSRKLKVGGYLVVDDTQIWTGEILKRFMTLEPEWRLIENIAGKAVVFRKVKEQVDNKEWKDQRFIVMNSDINMDFLEVFPKEIISMVFSE